MAFSRCSLPRATPSSRSRISRRAGIEKAGFPFPLRGRPFACSEHVLSLAGAADIFARGKTGSGSCCPRLRLSRTGTYPRRPPARRGSAEDGRSAAYCALHETRLSLWACSLCHKSPHLSQSGSDGRVRAAVGVASLARADGYPRPSGRAAVGQSGDQLNPLSSRLVLELLEALGDTRS